MKTAAFIASCLLIITAIISECSAYPFGAPSCAVSTVPSGSMLPNSGGSSSFVIRMDGRNHTQIQQYKPCSQYTLTIQDETFGQPMKGFLLYASNGAFKTPLPTSTKTMRNALSVCLTQTQRGAWNPISVAWLSPSSKSGPITITAVAVVSKNSWYIPSGGSSSYVVPSLSLSEDTSVSHCSASYLLPPPSTPIQGVPLALMICAGLWLGFGLVLTSILVRIKGKNRIVHFLLRTRVGVIPRALSQSRLGSIFNYMESVVNATYGDLLAFIVFYIGSATMWFVAWYIQRGRLSAAFGRLNLWTYQLLLLPVARNSLWLTLIRSSFEQTIRFHRWLARSTLIATFLHGLFSSEFGYSLGNVLSKDFAPNTPPILGFIGWGAGLVSGALGLGYIRRRYFELFYWTHPLALLGVIGACFHAPDLVYFLIPGLSFWIIDRVMRVYRGRYQKTEVMCIQETSAGYVKIDLKKEGISQTSVEGSAYGFICIPSVSVAEWHPITLVPTPSACSASSTSTTAHHALFSLYIKPVKGLTKFSSWTSKLLDQVQSRTKGNGDGNDNGDDYSDFKVLVDGPYGQLQFHPQSFKRVLLVGGGSGFTSTTCVAEYILNASPHTVLNMVYAAKSLMEVDQVKSSLPNRSCFNIDFYVTSSQAGESEGGGDGVELVNPPHNQTEGSCSKIKYGRPDIAKIIHVFLRSEGDGDGVDLSDFAVIVSGPQGLRTEVYRVCWYSGVYVTSLNYVL